MTIIYKCDKCGKIVESSYQLNYVGDDLEACNKCYEELRKLKIKWIKNIK